MTPKLIQYRGAVYRLANGVTPEQADAIIKKAEIEGFGGNCGLVAVAINRVVFDGQGKYVGAFNAYMQEVKGEAVGHVAVRYQNHYFDSDGLKALDEVMSWGMLDPEDHDYFSKKEIKKYGEDIAYDVELYIMDEQEVIDMWTSACTYSLEQLENMLKQASLP